MRNGDGPEGCVDYRSVGQDEWRRREGEGVQSKQTFEVSSLRT